MRIIYPVSEGFDPQKARFHQIFQTSHALAKRGCHVDLIMGRNSFDLLTEVLPYYHLEPHRNLHLDTACMLRREGKQKVHISWNEVFHVACWFKIRMLLRAKPYQAIFTRHLNIARFFLRHRKSLGLPVIFEAHEIFHLTTDRRKKAKKIHQQENRVYSRVDGIIATTESVEKHLHELFSVSCPVKVIPNGVNVGFFETTREKTGNRQILYVGQLYPWKGVDVLVKAMQFIADGELHIVGGGTDRINDLARQAEQLGVDKRIFFHGQVAPSQVKEFLRKADVAVHPLSMKGSSQAEFSSPLKMFEYMAAQVPVVASDLPGIRDIIKEKADGLLVPPDDPQALANGIRSILDNPVLGRQLAEKAYETVRQYSWEKRAERIEQFIRDVCHPGASTWEESPSTL